MATRSRKLLTRPDDAEIDATSNAEKAEPTPEDKARAKYVEKVLTRARKQARAGFTGWEFYRGQAKLDNDFHIGTWGDQTLQWPPEIAAERKAQNRACLTVNRMPGFTKLVTNQARQANLRILVKPVDDGGDVKLAEVIQGLMRNVETQSFAEQAVYSTASEKQAMIGLGFIRLKTEWANDTSWRQRIRMKREKNPLLIIIDPSAEEPDWSDAKYAFKFTAIDRDTYEDLYGHAAPEPASLNGLEDGAAMLGDWFPNEKIGIAEYFNREPRGKQRIAQLADGRTIEYPAEADIDAVGKVRTVRAGVTVTVLEGHQRQTQTLATSQRIKRDREVTKYVMMWRTIDAQHILEESEWAADAQPWIPVIGREVEKDGIRDLRGVTRDAKGSAQVYNVSVTSVTETSALGSKAPVVGYTGQFGKPGTAQRRAWETAHLVPHPFLEVEPLTIDGKPAAIPQRASFEPPIQAQIIALQQASEDLKSTAGFRDASLAERGPQESGVAITARQRQDELGSSDYLDNLRFALCAAGKQLIQLFRVIYDEPTVVRITGKADQQRKVMVFSGATKDPRREEFLKTAEEDTELRDGRVITAGQLIPFELPDGVSEIYDLAAGEFDVEVTSGPDPGTRREEELQYMGNLAKGMPPELMVNFLDLMFGLIDSSKGQQMAERAKKLLPPQLQDHGDGGEPEIPAHVQQQMMQLKQQAEQATQALQQAMEEIRTKGLELQSRERIEKMKIVADRQLAGLKIYTELVKLMVSEQNKDDRLILEKQIEHVGRMLELQTAPVDHNAERAAEAEAAAASSAGAPA